MSTAFYDKLFSETHAELTEIIEKELERPSKTEKARRGFHAQAIRYIHYLNIVRKLDMCYDQMIHPQKRLLIRKLLDGAIGRILEIRHEMVSNELSEILCFDEVVTELQITYDDLEIPIPRYIIQDRKEELKSRNETMDYILTKYGLMEKPDDGFVKTTEEAVLLIQRMERGRQGKLKAHFMRELYNRQQQEKGRAKGGSRTKDVPEQQEPEDESMIDPQIAALKIQQLWKGYKTWKRIQQERKEELIFLGMIPPPTSCDKRPDPKIKMKEIEVQRHQLQTEHERAYKEALTNIKSDILHDEGFVIMDNLQTQIRNWFFTYKDRTGRFPDYPSDEQGGYDVILRKGIESDDDSKHKIKSHKKPLSRSQSGSSHTPTGSKRSSASSTSMKPPQSHFLPEIVSASSEYRDLWDGASLTHFPESKYDVDIIKEEKRQEAAKEIRAHVDALMRQELDQLKMALLRDKFKKGKKLRAALKREQKKKKKKQKTFRKKKREKDLTQHKSTEVLYEELIKEGIIKKYPQVALTSYLGEANYLPLNPTKKKEFIATTFSPADVRRFVTEYCILPLGCKEVHSRAPMVKSVLLVGPTRSGKSMLVNAICSEVGATLFDITATNLLNKYPGREGLKMLFHLVAKIGRLMQPSVILIEDADKMFMKKLPKTDKTDPKKTKKGLLKLIKSLGADDRILLLGTSQAPFECEMKGFGSLYNKICCISRPDHASRFVLWNQLIQIKGGRITSSMDVSILTKVSDGYSSGSIAMAINKVLTPHRIALQKRRILQPLEFISMLAKFTPVYKEEEQAMKAWYLRTPLIRKKLTSLQPEEKKSARDKTKTKDGDKKKEVGGKKKVKKK